jgi:hypothetical protein
MAKPNKKILNIFKWLHTEYRTPKGNRSDIQELLKQTWGFDYDEASKIYDMWFFNYQEDGDYHKLTDIVTKPDSLLKLLVGIRDRKIDDDDIPEQYYGEHFGDSTSFGYNDPKLPWISFNSNGTVDISVDRNNDEHVGNLSGLWEHDRYTYLEAVSRGYSETPEYFDSDEFNYILFDSDTIEILQEMATLKGLSKYINLFKKGVDHVDSEDIVKFLKLALDKKKYDSIVDEYIWSFNRYHFDYSNKKIEEYYDSQSKYDPNFHGGRDVTITVPIEDLIKLVQENLEEDAIYFDELLNIEFNDAISVEDIRWESHFASDEEQLKEFLTEFNDDLGRVLEKMEEEHSYYDDDVDYGLVLSNFEDMMAKLKFTKDDKTGNLVSPDGNTIINPDDLDLMKGKVKISYKGESHIVEIDDIPNWVMGSVIHFNESIVNRKLLNESTGEITKLSVFDFDGTLADTPKKEEGIKTWEEVTGQKYPHRSWYNRRESLDNAIFDIKLNDEVIRDYMVESRDPNTLTIMLTGRLDRQANSVEKILNSKGIVFDEYHYKEEGGTVKSKTNTLKQILMRHPSINEVEMWEDVEHYANHYEMWGNKYDVNLRVNRV